MDYSDLTRCRQCGGRLDRAAYFCHPCDGAFCSPACLARHRAREHAPGWVGAPAPHRPEPADLSRSCPRR
jgi:hypothetical protein